jgi:hypothetical protein
MISQRARWTVDVDLDVEPIQMIDAQLGDEVPMEAPEGYRSPNSKSPAESVFGTDDRTLVTNPRADFAASINGSIQFQTAAGMAGYCSGTLVGSDIFLTSAHCVHSGSGGAAGLFTDIDRLIAEIVAGMSHDSCEPNTGGRQRLLLFSSLYFVQGKVRGFAMDGC